jgi:hypothetical protein
LLAKVVFQTCKFVNFCVAPLAATCEKIMGQQVLPSFILILNGLVYVADRDWLSRTDLSGSNYELSTALVNNGAIR